MLGQAKFFAGGTTGSAGHLGPGELAMLGQAKFFAGGAGSVSWIVGAFLVRTVVSK